MSGRPQKQNADYFSHDAHASEGKTLSILFADFGHEGISAWWGLLERLTAANSHFIFAAKPEDIEFLAYKLHFNPERLLCILNKMATLDAIDTKLWSYRIIWCQNLVERLEPLYKQRKATMPEKPNPLHLMKSVDITKPLQEGLLLNHNDISSIGNSITSTGNAISKPIVQMEIPQSKVKESKVKIYNTSTNVDAFEDSQKLLLKEGVKKVFEGLKERRKIPSPQADAEAVAIRWMLKHDFTVEKILKTYDGLKQKDFWADKLLNMQSVKSQINDFKEGGQSGKNKPGAGYNKVPDSYQSVKEVLGPDYPEPPDFTGSVGQGNIHQPGNP
jgi:hypothetical protein